MMANQSFAMASSLQQQSSELRLVQDTTAGILWCTMQPNPRPCFTPRLLAESREAQRHIVQRYQMKQECPEYVVLASGIPDVFNLGGDLALFVNWIEQHDEEALRDYAQTSIDVCYRQAINLNLPLTTIALVQGDAMGGGFEAALSCSVLIAEKRAQFGLPETLFNLFPGMGAYSFLARRLDQARAERLILSGKLYSATELYEMGVVDVLAENGAGQQAVYEYIHKRAKRQNSYLAMQRVRQRYHPITYQELSDIAEIWIESALRLSAKDLKMMQRLIRAQNRMQHPKPALAAVRSA